MTKFNACRMKITSDNPTLWSAELENIHQHLQKAGAATEKSDAEMIVHQIPKEYKVATQGICIMPAANKMLKTVQQVYVDLRNAK